MKGLVVGLFDKIIDDKINRYTLVKNTYTPSKYHSYMVVLDNREHKYYRVTATDDPIEDVTCYEVKPVVVATEKVWERV